MLKTRALIIFISLTSLLIYSETLSQPTQKQPITQSKSKQLTKSKTATQENPSEQFVTSQQMIDAITRAIDASNEKYKTAHNTPQPKSSMDIFQLVLTIFTGCLVIVGGIQCYIIFYTLKETEKAANAATESSKVAKEALHISERAYLIFDHFAFEKPFQQGSIPQIKMSVINNGRTPAQIMNIFATVDVVKKLPEKPIYKKGHGQFVQSTIGANIKHTIGGMRRTDVITAEEFADIHHVKSTLYVWGRIIYQDVFNKQWVAGFGAEHSPHGFLPIEGYNYIAEYEQDKEQS